MKAHSPYSFTNLPLDIIHHIISYNDIIKLRNGKYMNQLSKIDGRYQMLQKIPTPRILDFRDGTFQLVVVFTKHSCESQQLRFHYNIHTRIMTLQYYCVLYTINEMSFLQFSLLF